MNLDHFATRILKTALAVAAISTWLAMQPAAAAVRAEMRGAPLIATGMERVGSADGSTVTDWDTTELEDGWVTRTSGDVTVDVLVLNTPAVVGGRMSASETWNLSRVVVVRDDVVVPSGMTLTLGAGVIVKFTEGARIVVEHGGELLAEGACLAAFDDDSVGGDTDMNGDNGSSESPSSAWWLDDAAVATLSTVRFVVGASSLPTRSYTANTAFGELPALTKTGGYFGGWFTGEGGTGEAVDAQTVVPSGETVLYAHWVPYELVIDPSSTTVDALATNDTFTVTANVEWTVECEADWISVTRGDAMAQDGGTVPNPRNVVVAYSVEENTGAQARTATIRVTGQVAGDDTIRQCDFTLSQNGMAQLAALMITPPDGTTFSGPSRRVMIKGAESGSEIRYSLDGSEPTAASKLYTKSFNVFDTTVVKAKAFKEGKLPSETVSVRIIRIKSLAEALDVPLWTIATDAEHPWTVDADVSHDGEYAARSGAIGAEESTTLSTTVEGSGTLTFWWKADCEDDPDSDAWDYLLFEVDGVEAARVDGDSGWRQVVVKVAGNTLHTLSWTYCKDDGDENMTGIEDCGWVDQITWTALVNGEVPVSWIEGLGVTSDNVNAQAAASLDPDGDGFTTAQEYLAGTDPTDGDSVLVAGIEIQNDNPVITYTPDLLDERQYTILGKKTLEDAQWVEVEDGEERNYKFFKVKVEMP